MDGDTADIEVALRLRVRLLDCWAPEKGQEGGQEATESLRMRAEGKDALVTIPLPTNGPVIDTRKMFTFGRFLGRLRTEEGDLGQIQVELNHATREKQ